MAYFKHAVTTLLSCLLIFYITGCLAQLNPTPEPTAEFSPDLPSPQYAPAIENLQAVARSNDAPAASQKAHLHLAWLYSSYKNPVRDYDEALAQIEQYLATQSQTDGLYDAENLQSLLTVITTSEEQYAADLNQLGTKTKQLQAQVDQLRSKADQLADANQTLTEQKIVLDSNNRELASYNKSLLEKNKEFEETIDRLKNLEMQLEQKRKTFK